MIDPHAYLLFIGAVMVLVIVPGPDMAYMLARTLAQGRSAGIVAAIGINAGAYVHVVAAVFGLSAVLATSSAAFTAVNLAGAGYLIWIGFPRGAEEKLVEMLGFKDVYKSDVPPQIPG